MKKSFNLNEYIYIQITELGWQHLEKTLDSPMQSASEYIKHCITPYKEIIDGQEWYKLQAHHVFRLLPIGVGFNLLYKPTILIDNKDLLNCYINDDKEFKKGDTVHYDNGKHQETFVVKSVDEHHLFSTEYNIPSFKKSYCTKVS